MQNPSTDDRSDLRKFKLKDRRENLDPNKVYNYAGCNNLCREVSSSHTPPGQVDLFQSA